MSGVHGTFTTIKAATRYHVTNRNFLQVATTLEYIQEERETPLIELYNQQQIYIYGSEVISTFHSFNPRDTLNEILMKHMK